MQFRMQKTMVYVLLILLLWVGLACSVLAEEKGLSKEQQNLIFNEQFQVINWEDMDALEEELRLTTPELREFDLKQTIFKMAKGEQVFSLEQAFTGVWKLLTGEIKLYISIVMQFVLVVILCNLLQTLSTSFETKNTSKVAFFVCYMIIVYGITSSLGLLVNLASTTIDRLASTMYVVIPTLLAFMATTGHVTTSAIFYPTIMGGISLIRFVVQTFMLPAIVLVIILQLVSTMSEDFKLDKLIKLFYRGSEFILKGIFWVSVGMLSVYKMTTVPLDIGVKKAALRFSTAFIPVVGDATTGAVEFIAQCATVVKNSVSGSVIIFILIFTSIPLIKMLTYIGLYHLAAAAIEPLGDKKMSNMAESLAKGCEFIMSCVAIMALLCIIGLLVCMSIGISGV